MKITKIILFAFLLFIWGTSFVSAMTVSDSVTVTVIGDGPLGTLTGENCTIPTGQSSCPTKVGWEVKNPVTGVATTVTTDKPVSNTPVGGGNKSSVSTSIAYPSQNFYLYHNETDPLISKTINAICDATKDIWNDTTGKCEKSTNPIGILTGENCTIPTGQSSCPTKVGWEVKNPVTGVATTVTTDKPVSNTPVGGGNKSSVSTSIAYPSQNFYLYHNETDPLISKTINAICDTADKWDGNKCVENIIIIDEGVWGPWSDWSKCSANACGVVGSITRTRTCSVAGGCKNLDGGNAVDTKDCYGPCYSADIKASPMTIKKNQTTIITWSSSDMESCKGTSPSDPAFANKFLTGLNLSGTYTSPKLAKSTTYSIKCTAVDNKGKIITKEDSEQVKVEATAIEEL